MDYIDLSMADLEKISVRSAAEIARDKEIDLVIYIARSGFPIGLYMSRAFQCRLLGIGAVRRGDRLKALAGRLFTCAPRFVRDCIFRVEFGLKIHTQHSERHVQFHRSLDTLDCPAIRSIVVVDDSVDTGNSMKQVLDKVAETFPGAQVTTYALNVFAAGGDMVSIDHYTFRDTFIRSPMSKDSREYKSFCELYQRETMDGYL